MELFIFILRIFLKGLLNIIILYIEAKIIKGNHVFLHILIFVLLLFNCVRFYVVHERVERVDFVN